MKTTLLLLLLCLSFTVTFAQIPSRYQIQGTAVDSASIGLPQATVMLLQRKDSSLINFVRANDKGFFSFKNIKKGEYLLKISYVGYIPFQKNIPLESVEVLDMGLLPMKLITKELFEVVVRTARAPLTIKGDTIEYNASSFKVPPGSTVEDLLRKLPGVQVDANGNIKAQGKEVKKVLVDGKQFFGSDPKAATQNLPAEAITKVQVYNDKSEQSKITGVDDGKKEKAINLELKEEFKKGGFGKITAGLGNINRASVKGNYNKFDKTNQFSLIGLANNANEGGMSWDDYQDFRGSNAFNFGDDGDFGFGGNGRYFSFSSGDDDDGGGLSIPMGSGGGRGFTNNVGLGANYNYDTKKNKLSASYFYNSTKVTLDALSSQQTFLPNNGQIASNTASNTININGNHRGSLRYEKTIDSLNTLIFINKTRLNAGNSTLGSTQLNNYSDRGTPNNSQSNSSTRNNVTNIKRFDIANTLIYRLKFMKKGRSLAASTTYLINNTDGSATQESLNKFYQATTANELIKRINQLQSTATQRSQFKASLLYVEPLSKTFFWETFYNFSVRTDNVDRGANDLLRSEQPRVDSVSVYYNNDLIYNRLGSSLRYSSNGINISAGLAAQRIAIKGRFANRENATTFNTVNRTFDSFVPYLSTNIELENNLYLNADYNVNISQPQTRDLQPVINNSDPLYVQQGNPDLLPEVSRQISAGGGMFNPSSFISLFANLNYGYNINQIIYNQTIDPKTLITTTKPENMTGGQSIGGYFSFGFPIKKTKLTADLSANPNFSNNLTKINGVLNETKNRNYSFSTRLDWTPNDNFTLFANAQFGISDSKFSISTAQNVQIYNNEYSLTMNVKMPKLVFFKTSLDYRTYKNERYNFDTQIPIWNASVYKILGKDKKAEIRLSAFDILNKNQGITQNAYQNTVSQERIQTLAQYFMLSFSYNMRGVKATLKKDNW
jgi:hypothetical protein